MENFFVGNFFAPFVFTVEGEAEKFGITGWPLGQITKQLKAASRPGDYRTRKVKGK